MYINPPKVELNADYATQIGHSLQQARSLSGQPPDEMGGKLLMSKHQIVGLENYDLSKFYSGRHFAQALMKYAEAMQLPIDQEQLFLKGALLAGNCEELPGKKPDASDQSATENSAEPDVVNIREVTEEKRMRPARVSVWIVGATTFAATIMALVGLTLLSQTSLLTHAKPYEFLNTALSYVVGEKTDQNEQDIMPQSEPSITPHAEQSITAELESPQKDTVASADTSPYVKIETNQNCWIQLHFTNGNVTQNVYPANTKLGFERGELKGLVIGNIHGAKLLLGGKQIALAEYQKPGTNVARVFEKAGTPLLGN